MRTILAAVAVLCVVSGPAHADHAFSVVNSGLIAYLIDGQSNPTLTLLRGETYTFTINAPGHPFWIKTVQEIGTDNTYDDGVSGNGASQGTLTFTVAQSAPDTLYYNCQFHTFMTGMLTISDAPPVEPAIDRFDLPGQIVFDEVPGAGEYRIEWSSAAGGSWTSFAAAAASLDAIPATGFGTVTARVPMLYRVVAVPAETLDLVISEIMYDSEVGDDVGEWFEVHNRGSQAVSLGGLILESGTGAINAISTNNPPQVAPGGYVVLGRSMNLLINGDTPVDYQYSDISLPNIGGTIMLKKGTNIIDRVTYSPNSPFPFGQPGRSIYVHSDALDPDANDMGENWGISTTSYGSFGQFGTPGQPNQS